MKLNNLQDRPGARRDAKRIGRGSGSGTGTTSGRGSKGQKSRSGVAIKGFEGGQMPIHRRLPKRGFKNIFRKRFNVVNLDRLQLAVDAKKLDPKKPVNTETLLEAGVITKARDGVRLLAKGELKVALNLEVAGASATAVKAVEAAGGKVAVAAPAKTAEQKAEKAAKRSAKRSAKKSPKAAAKKGGAEDKPADGGGKKADNQSKGAESEKKAMDSEADQA